jgi:hypothetical protein
VYLFVDNSNIFISAKAVAETREGRAARDSVRLQFENLLLLAHAGRDLAKAFVVGSIPPEQRTVWDRMTAATGIVPELYERGSLSGGEQGLDQCLQVHMLRALSDNPDPQISVLLTGDGAGYDDGVGFHADMARLHAAGWGIEVLSWGRSCRRTLREWATANGCFVSLDEYYESVTFLEGGRRSIGLDLSTRPTATVRPSPSQLAAARARQNAADEIESLKREVEELTRREAGKAAKRERFKRKLANQQASGKNSVKRKKR